MEVAMQEKDSQVRFKAGQRVFLEITRKDGYVCYEEYWLLPCPSHPSCVSVPLYGDGPEVEGPFDSVTGEYLGETVPFGHVWSVIRLVLDKPDK